jgi:CHAD domain-containing protein
MEGYSLVNSDPLLMADGRARESFQRQWREQLAEWRMLLKKCGEKPGRKRVHGLRVATLRIQALLEFWQRAHGGDPAAHAVKRWSRQAKKLREALQPVRSVEVCRGLLAELRRQVIGGSGAGPDCASEISELQRRFMRRRKVAAKEVVEEIGDRRARLERWGKEIECAIREPVAGDGIADVREQIAGLKAEFPALTADCLHAFRKRVKNLRYLAEFVAEGDAQAALWARSLSKMQGVIGEWRDWQLLAVEARRILKKKSELPDLLAGLEAKALRRALRFCRRCQRWLFDGAEEAQNKKPVRAVQAESGRRERQRA